MPPKPIRAMMSSARFARFRPLYRGAIPGHQLSRRLMRRGGGGLTLSWPTKCRRRCRAQSSIRRGAPFDRRLTKASSRAAKSGQMSSNSGFFPTIKCTFPTLVPRGQRAVFRKINNLFSKKLARPEGLEPPTPRFVVWCSIQLSYGRKQAAGCSGTSAAYQPPKAGPV
jgi:hypothetical protein